ncbi:hypothetical protein ETD83_40885 [Actinomadura soli]|uniref:DUF2637 domain-containing protein n=1 Tax=Actinomadura soli TaxID=2508997 RepID=A0A5C4IYR4_9ACTN|nr:hypothetical protein [Actinomadura soli]TMQ84368.1 hypothetical protein ETD83_40885 [Actinomadura soli]
MVILNASRRQQPASPFPKWSLAVGIVATVGANVAHGATHGVIGAIVSAWPALALVGSFELLMTLTRTAASHIQDEERIEPAQPRTEVERTPEQAVLDEYRASLNGPGRPLSQRYLVEKYGIDRRECSPQVSVLFACASQVR